MTVPLVAMVVQAKLHLKRKWPNNFGFLDIDLKNRLYFKRFFYVWRCGILLLVKNNVAAGLPLPLWERVPEPPGEGGRGDNDIKEI